MEKVEGNVPNLVVMTAEDLKDVIKNAADVGSKVALKKFEALVKQEREQSKDKRLHNTEKLLRNYHMFKLAADNAVYELQDIEAEESANEILYAMLNKDGPGITVESIRKSVIKTVIILEHIDAMIQMYQIYCERTGDPVQMRRYNILYDRFIADPTLSPKDIAEKYHISKTLVYADIQYSKEKIAALLFGIDSIK
ncbi:MAG: hypothetical protein J5929_09525 [Eubacterium sp.]|nr:hypothetical protein [Eubacterium sp.]